MNSFLFWCLVTPLLVGYGAFARRVMGGVGGKWPSPFGKAQRGAVIALFVLPLVVPVAVFAGGVPALLALVVAGLAASTGDGDQTDLGTWFGPEPDKPFWGFVNENLGEAGAQRDFIGLLVSGVATTAAPGLMLAIAGHYMAGFVLAFGGLLKGPAYALAYALPAGEKVRHLHQGRELGEAFWGGSVGFVAAAAGFLSL